MLLCSAHSALLCVLKNALPLARLILSTSATTAATSTVFPVLAPSSRFLRSIYLCSGKASKAAFFSIFLISSSIFCFIKRPYRSASVTTTGCAAALVVNFGLILDDLAMSSSS